MHSLPNKEKTIESNKTFALSPSTLKLAECPKCLWLHFNAGFKRPSGAFPTLPSGVDKALKSYFDRLRPNLPPILNLPEAKLFNEPILKDWQNNFRGIRTTDEKGNVLFGAVDELLVEGEKITVLDFKTRGFPLKQDTASYYVQQLELYTYLLKLNGREVNTHAYLLFFISDVIQNDNLKLQTELVKVPVNIQNAQKTFEQAIKILEGPEPASNPTCQYCTYRGT